MEAAVSARDARWQESSAPIERTALHALAIPKNDITRQVAAFAAKPISDPCARTGKTRPQNARVDLIKRRNMVTRFSVERFDKRKVVHMRSDVGVFLTHPRA